MDKETAKVIVNLAAPVVTLGTFFGIGIVAKRLDQTQMIKKLKAELIQEKAKSTINYVRDQYVYDKQFEDIVTKIEN